MPNPVAVNDLSPISGSLQTSRISYGVETAGKNYGQNYNSTNWYSDIPNNGQFYTIISDNYTANYYVSRSNAGGAYVEGGLPAVDDYSAPVFWITQGTSSLDVITIVNGLPDRVGQVPFNSGSQALNWVASSSNYFAVGPDYYAQIDADQMLFYVNASQVISYPTTQSTWYDLSGNSSNVSLQNTPSWDSNGWFSGDGTDDRFVVSPTAINYSRTALTVEAFIYYNASYSGYKGAIMSKWQTGAGSNNEWSFSSDNTASAGAGPGNLGLVLQYTSAGIQVVYGTTVMVPQKWYHCVATYDGSNIRIYTNGKLETTTAAYANSYKEYSTQPTALLGFGNGLVGGPDYYPTNARLSEARIYNKAISTSEVAQNYYGGPIVTDGLIFAVDAGNLVSYPKSGTSTYNLTGSSNNGTLINGTGFSSTNGGTWTFDGTDDGINIGTLTPTGGATFEAWIWLETGNTNYGAIFTNWGSSANAFFIGTYPSSDYIQIYFNNNLVINTISLPFNTWMLLTVTNDGTNVRSYINGALTNTASGTLVSANGVTSIGYDVNRTDYPFKGNISNAKIYNRALTAAEVLQNYNATN